MCYLWLYAAKYYRENCNCAHERLPIGLANRRANLSFTVCNKIYNFHFSAYFKLFARSETKDHLFTLQVRAFKQKIGFKRHDLFLRIFFSNIHRILFGSFSGQVAEPLRIQVIIVLLHYVCAYYFIQ